MGQCFRRCCHSNRVHIQSRHSDSTISLAHDWIDSDDSGTKENTGDKNHDNIIISESLTLDDIQQTNDTSIAVIQPSEPSAHIDKTVIDDELEQVLKENANQDQSNQAQYDNAGENQCVQGYVSEARSMIDIPDGFDYFIRHIIVPMFEQQRCYNHQNQFAVLLLVTNEDLRDISQMRFHPNSSPITNNSNLSMPENVEQYHNYIVARPKNDNHHAEKEIFEHLDQLWDGFLRHSNNGIPPKCFILYSWNFPCTKCTQLIINSFNKPLYKSVSVIVVATAFWDKEDHEVRHQNEEKMQQEKFRVKYYRGIQLPEHSFISTESTDSYSDDFDYI